MKSPVEKDGALSGQVMGILLYRDKAKKLTAELLAYLLQLIAQPVKYCFFHPRCSQHFSFVHF